MMRVPVASVAAGEASCASARLMPGMVQNAPAIAAAPVIFARSRRFPDHAVMMLLLYSVYEGRIALITQMMMGQCDGNNKWTMPDVKPRPRPSLPHVDAPPPREDLPQLIR